MRICFDSLDVCGVLAIGSVVALNFNVLRNGGAVFSENTISAGARAQGSEPPFVIAQGIVLLLFILAGVLAVKRFHPVVTNDRV